MIEVYAIRIDEPVDDKLYNQFLSCVSGEKYKRIKKFHFIEDAKRTLYGDLMVRYLACIRLKMPNSELLFGYNEFGKPYLCNNHDFHFNISHSGNWVICAISEKKVGADIEQIKPINFNIAKHFFSEIEYEDLMMQQEKMQLNYFYDIWTLKESYIKCIGKGLSIPLDLFSLTITKGGIVIKPNPYPYLYFQQIPLEKGYKLSVCSEENRFSNIVQVKSINIFQKVKLMDIREK